MFHYRTTELRKTKLLKSTFEQLGQTLESTIMSFTAITSRACSLVSTLFIRVWSNLKSCFSNLWKWLEFSAWISSAVDDMKSVLKIHFGSLAVFNCSPRAVS